MSAGYYKKQKSISKFDSALNVLNTVFNPLTTSLTAALLPNTNMNVNSMIKIIQILQLLSSGVGGVTNMRNFYNIMKSLN